MPFIIIVRSNHDWLRSICVDKLYHNPDGTIKLVKQTKKVRR